MKDYSFGEDKEFILGYEKKDGKIIVNYAKNKKLSFPYSKEKEIMILDIMKKQAIENKYDATKSAKETLEFSIGFTAVNGFFAVISALPLILNGITVAPMIFLVITTGLCLFGASGIIDCKRCLKDIEKSGLFLKNESKITDMMQENVKSLDNTLMESKISKMYNELENPELTLNNIDKLSLKDLKRILESIEHSKTLGVQTTDAFEETLEALQKIKRK